MEGPKPSDAWRYFYDDKDLTTCTLCGHQLKKRGNVGNLMMQHMQRAHPEMCVDTGYHPQAENNVCLQMEEMEELEQYPAFVQEEEVVEPPRKRKRGRYSIC